MPVFSFKALKEDGGAEGGVIDADSPKEARLKLKGRKLHVTELEAIAGTTGGAGPGRKRRAPLFRRRKVQEIAVLTRQLATLLGSGIPIMGSLAAVIEQAEDLAVKGVLLDVRDRVAQGSTFSDALEAHPFYFNELYCNMVRAGEASGALDKVLFRIADYMHAQHRLRAKMVAALTYPIIMMIIGTGVVFVLLTYVVPKILDVLEKQKKGALPLPTEILLTVSGFMGTYWWAFIIGGVALWLLYRYVVSTAGGRLWVDTRLLDVPVLGPLLRKSAVSRFAVTFATLLESGLPVLDALLVVKRVVNNQLLANTLDVVRQRIAEGADIATPLKSSKVFPPVVGYMIAVGEESGHLESLLKKVAEAYDEEVELAAQRLTSLLEPVMIVFMAFVVGFIVLSILLPILQMSNI